MSRGARAIGILGLGALAACGGVETTAPFVTVSITTSVPWNGSPPTVRIEGPGECPRPDEWALVTWPEMEPVPSTVGPVAELEDACSMPIVPELPLTERWYAVHWRGEPPAFEHTWGAVQLRDGSRAWRFQGVVPVVVTQLVTIPWEGHVFVEARVSQEIDPGPGYDWGTMMTATQGSIACTYPGTEVIEGSAGIGFFETLVVECEGIDWNAPLHIHVEGAVARHGSRAPVAVVDVEHTFGSFTTDSAVLTLEHDEPAPPPAPPELCDTPTCS